VVEMIDAVLSRPEVRAEPPILVDIGASGEVNSRWKAFASHSICIAFDADSREMDAVRRAATSYRHLYIYDCIVTTDLDTSTDFFLTTSPYCSSTLEPDSQALSPWLFSNLFAVESKIKLKARSLSSVLAELGVERVDWIKIDSQGTDLRLFESLPRALTDRILVAEFEPGIIDSYRGEDKLHQLMSTLDGRPFWMSDLRIRGSKRLALKRVAPSLRAQDVNRFARGVAMSPGWGEVTYMNKLQGERSWSKRDYMVSWVFACIERQYGFALEIALEGSERFADPLFHNMEQFVTVRAKRDGQILALQAAPQRLVQRFVGRVRRLTF
jgi:hypothetical protein